MTLPSLHLPSGCKRLRRRLHSTDLFVDANATYNSRFIAFLGMVEVVNIHPYKLTDYAFGNDRTITLTFATTGLTIKLIFGKAAQLSEFWDLFRELKKAGDGRHQAQQAQARCLVHQGRRGLARGVASSPEDCGA